MVELNIIEGSIEKKVFETEEEKRKIIIKIIFNHKAVTVYLITAPQNQNKKPYKEQLFNSNVLSSGIDLAISLSQYGKVLV